MADTGKKDKKAKKKEKVKKDKKGKGKEEVVTKEEEAADKPSEVVAKETEGSASQNTNGLVKKRLSGEKVDMCKCVTVREYLLVVL